MFQRMEVFLHNEVIADFLKSAKLLPKMAGYQIFGWSEATGDSKRAMREAPDFVKIGKEIYFPYDAVEKFLHQKGAKIVAGKSPADDAVIATMLRG